MCLFFSGSDDYKYGNPPLRKPRKFFVLSLVFFQIISKSVISFKIVYVFRMAFTIG